MTLDTIILSININNFSNLYQMLCNSHCKYARQLLYKIQQGQDLYESIGSFYDAISQVILLSKNLNSILLFQKYYQLRNKFLQSIRFAAIYPIILLAVEFLLFYYTKHVLTIPWIHIAIGVIINISVFYYLYKKIYNTYVKVILLHNLLGFCHGNINYKQLENIAYIINHQLPNDNTHNDISELSNWYCNYHFTDLQNLIYDLDYEEHHLQLYIDALPNWFITVLLLQIGYLCYLFIISYHNIIIKINK